MLNFVLCAFYQNFFKGVYILISLVAQMVKHLPIMWETRVQSLGWEDPLEKEMATHSSTLAWKIPWTEEPGRLQSVGSQRVEHDWVTSLTLCAKSLQSCPTICDPADGSPLGSSVHGILQARILEWVAMPSFRGNLPDPGIEPMSLTSPALTGRFFTTHTTWEVPLTL